MYNLSVITLALKAKKVSSDEETSCSCSDEEYAMAEKNKGKEERRCFKCGDPNHFISDCPKHSFNGQKAFVEGCRSDSEEEDDSKNDEIYLKALDNNEVLSDTLYYSGSSLDNNEVCDLKNRLELLEKNKEISVECESCVKLHSKNESLSLKQAKFENSSYFLQEISENQISQKDKKGIGFTEDRASTSEVKTGKIGQESGKTPTIEPAEPIPSARELASSNEGDRPPAKVCGILDSNLIKRTSSVQINKKTLPNATVENVKQTLALKLGQGLGRSKFQT
ncbi:zf-CCHC domain-containing protein [Tanacetum coccineum]